MKHMISLFEALNFRPNEENIVKTEKFGELFDCVKICKENPEVARVIKKFIDSGVMNMHDAAIFAAYFGEPVDEKEKEQWKQIPFSEKVSTVLNKIMKSGSTSFTIIL